MIQKFLMNVGILRCIGSGRGVITFAEFQRGAVTGLKNHGHPRKWGYFRLVSQVFCGQQRFFIASFYQCLQHGILGWKIIIDASFSNPGSLGNLTDGDGLYIFLLQQRLERIQNHIVFLSLGHFYRSPSSENPY